MLRRNHARPQVVKTGIFPSLEIGTIRAKFSRKLDVSSSIPLNCFISCNDSLLTCMTTTCKSHCCPPPLCKYSPPRPIPVAGLDSPVICIRCKLLSIQSRSRAGLDDETTSDLALVEWRQIVNERFARRQRRSKRRASRRCPGDFQSEEFVVVALEVPDGEIACLVWRRPKLC